MQFTKSLRAGVAAGEITCSVRVWKSPRVKVGGRYRMDDGHVVVERVREITFDDITPELARRSGFASVPELLRTAVHGEGRRVFLVEFRFSDGNDTDDMNGIDAGAMDAQRDP